MCKKLLSSGRGGELGVPLELGWYSGFLSTDGGPPLELSYGDSSLAGLCRVAPILLQCQVMGLHYRVWSQICCCGGFNSL